ncbi:MAG: hypothetical protein PHR25_01735 [Clostridia bacterium]|nr:hypothetical protein [Clostridia bacterium]MDD4375483.1 hypothetical protein [Clostridia bacterium]
MNAIKNEKILSGQVDMYMHDLYLSSKILNVINNYTLSLAPTIIMLLKIIKMKYMNF